MIGDGNKPRDPLSPEPRASSWVQDMFPTKYPDYNCMLCGNTPKLVRDAYQTGYQNGLAEAPKPATDTGAGLLAKIEAEASRYAGHYPHSSDGRNTFVMFADYVAALATDATDGAGLRGKIAGVVARFSCTYWDAGARHDLTQELLAALTHPAPSGASGEGRCSTCGQTNSAFFCSNGFHAPFPTTPGGDLLEQAARYRHVKRGTVYEVVGEAELQTATGALVDGSALVVYRGDDGKLWAREEGEFHDGRFAALSPARNGAGS